MLTTTEIRNYRTFSALALDRLCRVNLFVGPNNTGKTALLEAMDLLVRSQDSRTVEAVLAERGELRTGTNGAQDAVELDFSGLFHGRAPIPGGMKISGVLDGQPISFCAGVHFAGDDRAVETREALREIDPRFIELRATGKGEPWRLSASSTRVPESLGLLAASQSGLLTIPSRVPSSSRLRDRRLLRMGLSRLPPSFVYELWDSVVLTEDEERVVASLRLIDEDIEKATVLGAPGKETSRAFVKLRGFPERAPLASLGEGVGRLFELALALSSLESGGILLVDEIDTGLHHRVLESLWAFILEETRRRNLQIAATTHSLDCLRALASCIDRQSSSQDDVCVQRLDPNQAKATFFSAEELQVAVQQELEIR